jgi:hypothetical protein
LQLFPFFFLVKIKSSQQKRKGAEKNTQRKARRPEVKKQERWIVALPRYIDWMGRIGIPRFLTRFAWFSLRFLCAFAPLR